MLKYNLTNGRLTDKEVSEIMTYWDGIKTRYEKLELYYKGQNYSILTQASKEEGLPDNKIPVPFGRKIATTVKNYLFNRDPIYSSPDKDYMNEINEIFYVNNHYTKSNDVGLDLIVHGMSYKIFYTDRVAGKTVPRYAIIDQTEGVPIYSMDIEPALIAFVRYYQISSVTGSTVEKKVEVYYSDVVARFNYNGGQLSMVSEDAHSFGSVPVVVYGDTAQLGVFEPVQYLIDAVDVIISSNLNEIQRFELLYLVLVGDKLPDDPDEVEKMVKRRIFELSENAQMSFLEKHIDSEFNMSLLDRILQLLDSMSGVPDFNRPDFAADSGIALQYKLLGLEQVAADIEAMFIKGEMDSLDKINAIMFGVQDKYVFFKDNPDKKISVELQRNLPEDVKAKLENAEIMNRIGISQETVLDYIPVVEDVEEEIQRESAEQEASFERFNAQREAQVVEPQEDIDELEE